MNATTTSTARPTVTHWDRRRDAYGRTHHVAITAEGGEYGPLALAGAVVTLPKVARAEGNYMVNLWGKGDGFRGEVTYHATLKEAKAYFAANALTCAEYRA